MRAAREIHAQRAETADEVLVQLDSIATRDTSALAQLERAGARLLASGSLTTTLQTYLKQQQGLVQHELADVEVARGHDNPSHPGAILYPGIFRHAQHHGQTVGGTLESLRHTS